MNFTLKQTRKAYRVSRDIALLFLKPQRYMGSGQRYPLAALAPGK